MKIDSMMVRQQKQPPLGGVLSPLSVASAGKRLCGSAPRYKEEMVTLSEFQCYLVQIQ